jgi:hypothetical protein
MLNKIQDNIKLMIKYRNITFPVVTAIEYKAAQLIAFALGYQWEGPSTNIIHKVDILKWLGFDPDTKIIRVYDRDYATDKSFDQAVNLNQLTEKLSNPTPTPKVPELPTGRPYAIVSFYYPRKDDPCRINGSKRIIRLASMDDDYLVGYEIANADASLTGTYKKFLVDRLQSSVTVIRQDIS